MNSSRDALSKRSMLPETIQGTFTVHYGDGTYGDGTVGDGTFKDASS
jgi:hypothetical protein